jgi:hypothetical protein
MGGLRKYLALQAQAKTGLSSGFFIFGLLAVVFGVLTAGFILLIAFIWLAERYEPLIAAAALAGFFLLVTLIALMFCLQSRRRTIERAELALAARSHAAWLDPKLLGGAIQASRAAGWRKLVPLLAVGLLAAGVGMEWFARDKTEGESDEQDREFARAA